MSKDWKLCLKYSLVIMSVVFLNATVAQESVIDQKYRDRTIETINGLLTDYYVFPAVAKEIEQHLNALNSDGYFNSCIELDSFASKLSHRIYEISKDRHIAVSRRPDGAQHQEAIAPIDRWVNQRMEERTFFRQFNANFKEVTKLSGNIGYLDLRGFYGLDYGKEAADRAMALLGHSDAIIIDLRNNSGGRGTMSDYLISYFFTEAVITSKTIKRTGETFVKRVHRSAKKVGGDRMPEVPLFLLTSNNTFSAAEGFTYALKAYNRAIVIGETTKGGANPGDLIPINDALQLFVPDVAVTHPITEESWEGTGIPPDIRVESNSALDTALVLAKTAAKKFKKKHDARARSLLKALDSTLTNFHPENEPKAILEAYLICRKNDLIFEEWEINALGNEMYEQNKLETATAILKANTILYPERPYTFNNYAEMLSKSGKVAHARSYFEKAVQVAVETGHPDIAFFKKSLENSKK